MLDLLDSEITQISTFQGNSVMLGHLALCKKAAIHQVTAKNVLFPGHNHLLTTGTDDLTL